MPHAPAQTCFLYISFFRTITILFFNFLMLYLFFERERASELEQGGTEREGDRESETGSRL